MEVGRRSSSSANEFSERRSVKKKMGVIPLAMILSFNDKDVHPDCPNISNPYHKCGRHCLDIIPSGKNYLDAIRSDGDRDREKKSERSGVNMNCPYASNPYHKCAEYCSEKMSDKRQDAGKDQPAMRLKGSEVGEMVLSAKDETSSQPQCKHASNPTHECAESCFQSVADRNVAEGEKLKRVSNRSSKSRLHLNRNASGHSKVTEYCFEDAPKKEHLNGDLKSKKENEIDLTAQRELNIECKNASNPHHLCDEYCFQSIPEKEQHGQGVRQKSSKEGEKVKNKIESTENSQGVSMETCSILASSPYNGVTEYNFEDTSVKGQPEGDIKPREEQGVNLERKSASNSDHVHAEYCLQSVPERERRKQTIKKVNEEDIVVLSSERGVSPECKFASNPYHVCAEYCFQNAPEREQHGQVMKLNSLKDLKKLISNKKVISEHPQCDFASNPYHQCAEYCLNKNLPGSKITDGAVKTNERKKEKSYALRRIDNPTFKNASKFTEYSPEEISPKNEAAEGSTATASAATATEKRRNSSKKNKRNHWPVVEKISLDSNYFETSKPSQNYIESSQGIILQDGAEKSSMNSTNNNLNSNNGVFMHKQDETKDLRSEKVVGIIKNPQEPTTDVPPLQIDASDLLHEWNKYCSQTKVAEDEIVKQAKKVGVGEFSTVNGKGNGFLKDNDSAKMEKRRTRNLKG